MLYNRHDLVNKSILYITPFAFTGKRFLMTTLRIKLETLMVCSQTMKGQTSMCKFNSDSYLDLFLHKINVGRDIYLRKDDKSVFRSYIFFPTLSILQGTERIQNVCIPQCFQFLQHHWWNVYTFMITIRIGVPKLPEK